MKISHASSHWTFFKWHSIEGIERFGINRSHYYHLVFYLWIDELNDIIYDIYIFKTSIYLNSNDENGHWGECLVIVRSFKYLGNFAIVTFFGRLWKSLIWTYRTNSVNDKDVIRRTAGNNRKRNSIHFTHTHTHTPFMKTQQKTQMNWFKCVYISHFCGISLRYSDLWFDICVSFSFLLLIRYSASA